MDIDKMFKIPKLPNSKKRQLPGAPTPEMLKRMRMDSDTGVTSTPPRYVAGRSIDHTKTKTQSVTLEEVQDEDMESQVHFAPGNDADYFAEEDEEGRFYGGGLTDEQKKILNIFDEAGGEGVPDDFDDLSLAGIRRFLLRFDRAVKKNQDQRSKYPDDPSKFIDSEADLDAAIKLLLPLAQVPKLAYPELVRSGAARALVDLLSHENVDIVIDVVEVVHELTDEDVGNEEEEDDDEGRREEALRELIEGLLEHSLLELLVQNLTRLNELEETDRQGVFHILGIFENTLGFNPELSTRMISETKILPWLLERISVKIHDDNRGYAAEVLSILLQDNRENRLMFGAKGGVEILLKTISQFRKRDPSDADETEFMENVFDILCSTLIEPETKQLFLQEEGVDLMVILMKEKKQSRSRAIKVLDHALSGAAGTSNSETFVEALGLKTLFSAFMGKAQKQKSTTSTLPAIEDTSHILGIISSLFSNIASESPARVRLLAKFVEGTYEKVDRLLEIRENAEGRLKLAEEEIISAHENLGEDEEDTLYLRRLDNGLFVLQLVDYILGWICMEDDGICNHVTMMMDRKNKSLKDIVCVLKTYRDNVGVDESRALDDSSPTQKEILEGLITFLDGC